MTAPDRIAHTLIKTLTKRGRPHMTMPEIQFEFIMISLLEDHIRIGADAVRHGGAQVDWRLPAPGEKFIA
jgi:hypothetical protein